MVAHGMSWVTRSAELLSLDHWRAVDAIETIMEWFSSTEERTFAGTSFWS